MLALASKAPNARAFALLAEARMGLVGDELAAPENCAEVSGLLDRALALDAANARARALRADVRFRCRHDAAGAEADYRRALALSPNDDVALRYSGLLMASRRFEEARGQIAEARRLNPLRYSAPTVAWLQQMQGRNDLALVELARMERAGVDGHWFHVSALRALTRAGREREAFGHLEWLMREAGRSPADLAAVRAAFDLGGLRRVYAGLLARRETADLGDYAPPLSWARYALAAGRDDEAMTYLEQAFAKRQSALLWAGVDPAYARVRDDPRFQAWLDEIGSARPGP
jgi:tetratricopeptide (TPR) repeat protein